MGKALSVLQLVQIASESHLFPSSVGNRGRGPLPKGKEVGACILIVLYVEVKSEWSYAFKLSNFFMA
jgi:hypothetical protein